MYKMVVTVTASDTMICDFSRKGELVERIVIENVSTIRDFNVRAAYACRSSREGSVSCQQRGIEVLRPFAA